VSSHVKKTRKSLSEEKVRSKSEEGEFSEERLRQVLDAPSLKDVSLDERRKEAEKPLYLARV